MTTPFIRPFNFDTDHSPCLHVFFTTLDPGASHEPARTIGAYLWYKAYAYLTPSTCLVLDDGSGLAVGYIIGTADTAAFSQRWKEVFTPVVDPKLVPPPETVSDDPAMETELVKWLRKSVHDGECSILQGRPDVLAEYPAHLHIDILPGFTGGGWGRKMMGAWLELVKGLGAKGVHLGMVKTNEGARRFYERDDFRVCGEVGTEGDALCLVRKL